MRTPGTIHIKRMMSPVDRSKVSIVWGRMVCGHQTKGFLGTRELCQEMLRHVAECARIREKEDTRG